MFEEIILLFSDYFSGFVGHLLVFILMTIESSFIPFPSEIIMIPAGFFSYLGNLNIYLVIILGTLGSVFGALINYFIGYHFGRKYLLKHKRFFFIKLSHLEKTETFFKKYGKAATFFGRLVPILRQYISIPAGFSRMNLVDFTIYTFLGSFLWVSFLSVIGYKLGIEISKSVINFFNIFLLLFICVFVIIFALIYYFRKIK
jgi:membrane protein DedA with SNARE-associated domain